MRSTASRSESTTPDHDHDDADPGRRTKALHLLPRTETDLLRELDGFEPTWLAAGSLIVVGLLALAALAAFGTVVSLAVLLVGTVLAVCSNPTVWLPDRGPARKPPPDAADPRSTPE